MGMLQLAGAVSGFGKGLQQGLQNTQQYMSQSLLLKERDDMERERLKLTFGHDEGMLQKKAQVDSDLMRERERIQQANAKEMKGIEQSNALKQLEVSHAYDKETAVNKAATDKELEDVRQKNRIAELVAKEGYSQQAAERQVAAEMQRARFKAREDERERNFKYGADVQIEKIKGENRAQSGSASGAAGKLDPNVNATLKVYDQELKDLGDELNNVMTKPERAAAIQRRMETIRNEQFTLLGRSRGDSQGQRPPIRFPE